MRRLKQWWRIITRRWEEAGALLLVLAPAWKTLSALSTFDWAAGKMTPEVANWLSTLGWLPLMLAGFLWLAVINRRGRRRDSERELAFERLRTVAGQTIREFERFCKSYEESIPAGIPSRVVAARINLDFVIARLLKAFQATLTAEERRRYEYTARGVLIEALEALDSEDLSRLGQARDPTSAIQEFLGMGKSRD
jgi:hypothetical protein